MLLVLLFVQLASACAACSFSVVVAAFFVSACTVLLFLLFVLLSLPLSGSPSVEKATLAAFDLPKCLHCFCCFFVLFLPFLLLLDAAFFLLCAVFPVVRVAVAAAFAVYC